MRNRIFRFVLAAAIALIGASGAQAQSLAQIKARGHLVIGTSGTGAPFTYLDSRNELIGYDIDWAAVIGKSLGVGVRFQAMPFSGLLPALQAGQIDMVMSAVRITDERRQTFDFSVPYSYEATVAIVRADNRTAASFDAIKGKVVAAVANSFQEEAVKKLGGYKTLLSLRNGSDIYLALRSGQAEIGVTGMSAAGHYINSGNADIRIAGEGVGLSPQGIVFRKGSDELRAAVDAIIVAGKADGTYQALFRKNIGVDAPADP
jgi:ABC-type amino acid transport substrate-binding protein